MNGVIATAGNGSVTVKPAYAAGKVSLSVREGVRGEAAIVALTMLEAEALYKELW